MKTRKKWSFRLEKLNNNVKTIRELRTQINSCNKISWVLINHDDYQIDIERPNICCLKIIR